MGKAPPSSAGIPWFKPTANPSQYLLRSQQTPHLLRSPSNHATPWHKLCHRARSLYVLCTIVAYSTVSTHALRASSHPQDLPLLLAILKKWKPLKLEPSGRGKQSTAPQHFPPLVIATAGDGRQAAQRSVLPLTYLTL